MAKSMQHATTTATVPAYRSRPADVFSIHATDPSTGLSPEEAARRLAEHGPNELHEKKKASLLMRILSQLKDFLVLVLITASIVSILVNEWVDAIVILAIVIVNAGIGVFQEGKAEKALEALKKMAAPSARVLRGGQVGYVPSASLVPGDVVLVEAGDIVPADLRLFESANLKAEEASLTGESVPVDKDGSTTFEVEVPLGDRVNLMFMSTIVTYGRGRGIVVGTGQGTEIGRIADRIQSMEEEATPLQQNLNQLGKWLGILCLAVCVVVFVVGLLQGGEALPLFLTAVSLAVAAIPEGLPAVVTIVLALGMKRMVRRNAIMKRLLAVETLGSVDTICSDKTGTLTQNEMTVTRLYCVGTTFAVGGTGYAPIGTIEPLEGSAMKDSLVLCKLLHAAMLCNDATLCEKEEGGWGIVGDPTEGALVAAAAKAAIIREEMTRNFPRVSEIPFDSNRKRMTTFHQGMDDHLISYTKGAPDIMVARCTFVLTEQGVEPLDEAGRNAILSKNHELASSALRVLAFAFRHHQKDLPREKSTDVEDIENGMTFIGLAGMIDPARPEVREAVRICAEAGIRPVMITGDYKDTAVAIAKDLGMMDANDHVLAGTDLDEMDDAQLRVAVEKTAVYARVSPDHKVRIVSALRTNGHIASMTGDGVNDAMALKSADIGVAMGITGTDVAKSTADMILTDDNFASIVSAVEEGRIIYDNIRKFVGFLLSCNVGEILVIFISSLILGPAFIPLLPVQLLWLNLVTDSFPALALGSEKGDPDIMARKPRKKSEPIINGPMLGSILVQAFGLFIAVYGVFTHALGQVFAFQADAFDPNGPLLGYARTMAFVTLSFAELPLAFAARSLRHSIFRIGWLSNRQMLWAFGLALSMLLVVVYVPFLNPVFDTVPLSLGDWAEILGFSLIPFVLFEIYKAVRRAVE
jgi:Ca2+-transporting ATPase